MNLQDVKDLIILLIAFALILIVGFIFAEDLKSYLIGRYYNMRRCQHITH